MAYLQEQYKQSDPNEKKGDRNPTTDQRK